VHVSVSECSIDYLHQNAKHAVLEINTLKISQQLAAFLKKDICNLDPAISQFQTFVINAFFSLNFGRANLSPKVTSTRNKM
jgi:hypothetical protein